MLKAVFSIPPEKRGLLAPFFLNANGLMRSCLQGHMGQAFGDHPDKPRAALLCIGDFASPGGDFTSPAARQMMGKLALERGKTWLIPALPGWEEHLSFWNPKRMERGTRYAVQAKTSFDKARLTSMARAIPPEFSLHPIEEELYLKAMAKEWSRDFCSQFHDAADYLRRGLGVVALKEGEIVAGASSYVVYDHGIEIQTDTREDMRRQGLAAACCAQLILTCLERGITPSWDAANPASLALAQKLGYTLTAPYDTWEVSF
jgi:GNAT superfamily N-acetyltransferase